MARRNDHTREELQALILNAAVSIVEEGGKEALTARSVSTKTGYVPGTIYNVYDSMDGLIMQINAQSMDMLFTALSKIPQLTKTDDTIKNLLKLAATYRKFVADHKNLWLLLFDASLPEDRTALDWYQGKVDRLFELIEVILMPVMAKESPHKIRMTSRILWSSFHGLCYLEEKGQFRMIGKDTSVSKMTELLVESFMAGLKSNKSSKKT